MKPAALPRAPQRRREDKGWVAIVGAHASQLWDWIDKRQIDAYVVSVIILYGTVEIMRWAMLYADAHHVKSGLEIAAIIAAVVMPYTALQGAAIKFLFEARKGTFSAVQPAAAPTFVDRRS